MQGDFEHQVEQFLWLHTKNKATAKSYSLAGFRRTDNLFVNGFFDSIEFLELISLVEVKFNLEIDFSKLDGERSLTIAGLTELISLAEKSN
jgi:acyl carrier protein